MTRRTSTIHNPVNFTPTDYRVVDYFDNKAPVYTPPLFHREGGPSGDDAEAAKEARQRHREELAEWQGRFVSLLGKDWPPQTQRCVHCGNSRVRWITIAHYIPTGEHVVFGAVCTARLALGGASEFKLARLKRLASAREATLKARIAYESFLATHPEVVTAMAEHRHQAHAKNWFAADVLAKLARFGSISAAQIAALLTSHARDHEFAARRAVEEAEVKGDAPIGRVEVTGTVLTVQERESDWGVTWKTLLKLTNNSKAWVTVPGGASTGLERGDTVTIRATWTPSRDDQHFAFGSRPTLVARAPKPFGVV